MHMKHRHERERQMGNRSTEIASSFLAKTAHTSQSVFPAFIWWRFTQFSSRLFFEAFRRTAASSFPPSSAMTPRPACQLRSLSGGFSRSVCLRSFSRFPPSSPFPSPSTDSSSLSSFSSSSSSSYSSLSDNVSSSSSLTHVHPSSNLLPCPLPIFSSSLVSDVSATSLSVSHNWRHIQCFSSSCSSSVPVTAERCGRAACSPSYIVRLSFSPSSVSSSDSLLSFSPHFHRSSSSSSRSHFHHSSSPSPPSSPARPSCLSSRASASALRASSCCCAILSSPRPESSLSLLTPGLPRVAAYACSPSCVASSAFSFSSFPSPSRPSSAASLVASLPSLGPHQLAPAARKLLNEGILEPQIWRQLSQRTIAICDELNVEQIALLLKVYALRKLQDFNLFSHLSARLIALAQASSPDSERTCSLASSSFPPSSSSPSSSSSSVLSSSSPSPSPFRGVDLTNILVACGRLLFSDRRLHALLATQLVQLVSELRPKDLVNIAHAYAKLRIADEEFFRLVAKALPPYVYDLTPIALANVCTSFASVGLYEEKLFDAVTAEAERRISEFGGCELLSLLLGLGKMQAALPPNKKRRDGSCISAILRALRGRMGPFGFVQNLQVLESLVLLGHYDSLFIHTKLLPALLARRPTPPGASVSGRPHSPAEAAAAATAETVLGLYLRVLCCLYRLPNLSQTGIQLLQEVAEQMPRCFQRTQIAGMAAALHLLHKLDCHDYDCFSKAEAILLADRVATLRQLRFANVLQLREAFRALGDEEHWGEVLKFLDDVVQETETLVSEARGTEDAHATTGMDRVHGAMKVERRTAVYGDSANDETAHLMRDERTSASDRGSDALAQKSYLSRVTENTFDEQGSRSEEVSFGDSDSVCNTRKPAGSRRPETVEFSRVSDSERESKNELELRPADATQPVRRRDAVVHAHQYSPDGEYTTRPVTLDKHVKKKNRATGGVKPGAEQE
ncbi:putative transmembrane protein [Toxoplasma gondii VEG]|uniref:Transmembrane protein n=2 Tax=Toxoplasma gondii (strain ATCC 50861 / VEG) TaxID=432359 RepID=V5BHA5_TOXGV|nr:putative transmembrane protein [Toxoplasma gondii VEG]